MKRCLVAVLIVMAGQAQALSCNFGDGAAAYEQAAQNGDDFRAVIGSLKWTAMGDVQTYMGGLVMAYEGQEHNVVARFTGEVMGPNGGRTPIDQMVRVQTWCANGDCGYASDQGDMLTFLHDTPDGTVMIATPCQSYPMGFDDAVIALVQSCLDEGPCEGSYYY